MDSFLFSPTRENELAAWINKREKLGCIQSDPTVETEKPYTRSGKKRHVSLLTVNLIQLDMQFADVPVGTRDKNGPADAFGGFLCFQ